MARADRETRGGRNRSSFPGKIWENQKAKRPDMA
jgi:hypothetical protein